MSSTPAFATDARTAAYYEHRAGEYDEWYKGEGLFAKRDRSGWDDELAQIVELARNLPPARTLDVACGTGFLTQHLRGFVVGIDQSPSMVALRSPASLTAWRSLAMPCISSLPIVLSIGCYRPLLRPPSA